QLPIPDLGGEARFHGNGPGCNSIYQVLGLDPPPVPVPAHSRWSALLQILLLLYVAHLALRRMQ
ncbi:MAG: hypothetical protein KJO85_03970, partial [Gammaproteobacteria bacterium]|nr:hypothetical protein [Gammaproteobacteria bacterium]